MMRLWHLAWSLSLLAAVAVAGAWIACGWYSYVDQRNDPAGSLERAIYIEQGHLYLLWVQPAKPSQLHMPDRAGWIPDADGRWWQSSAIPPHNTAWSILGIGFAPAPAPGDLNWLVLPLPWLMTLALLLPTARLGQVLRAVRRARTGRCARCGYDLRASRDACPECGQTIPPKIPAG